MLTPAGELISQSFALYKKHRQFFLRYMMLLFIPTAIITVISNLLAYIPESDTFLLTGLYAIALLVATIVGLWITIAFIRATATTILGKKPAEIKKEMQGVKHLIWPTIWVSFVVGLIILGGTVLFIIPGIIFSIWFSFVVYAIVLEEHTSTNAIKDSKAIVQGRWWAVFWRLVAPGFFFTIIVFIAQGIISFPINRALSGMSAESFSYIALLSLLGLLSSLISVLITPLSTAAPTMLYLELKKTAKKK